MAYSHLKLPLPRLQALQPQQLHRLRLLQPRLLLWGAVLEVLEEVCLTSLLLRPRLLSLLLLPLPPHPVTRPPLLQLLHLRLPLLVLVLALVPLLLPRLLDSLLPAPLHQLSPA